MCVEIFGRHFQQSCVCFTYLHWLDIKALSMYMSMPIHVCVCVCASFCLHMQVISHEVTQNMVTTSIFHNWTTLNLTIYGYCW